MRRSGVTFAIQVLLGALALFVAPANAHFVAAQNGTLNLDGDGAFLVLSVPVSALRGIDEDGDGALSKDELQAQMESIRQQVQSGGELLRPEGPLPLQLMMVDTGTPTDSQLTLLGRFQLRASGNRADVLQADLSDQLSLRFALFGSKPAEREQHLTVYRGNDSQWLRFTPDQPRHALFPGRWSVLTDYVYTGASHVLGGVDHLLFLLVVLSAGWAWRGLLGALTCFTVGHAITLVACFWSGWSVRPGIVEPAIAATIVGLAGFDSWGRWRARPTPVPVRLTMVFACSLVHGLGLASALAELNQWPPDSGPMRWALVGFNMGIEIAQIGVAAALYVLAWGLRRQIAAGALSRISQVATAVSMAIGTFWFAQRLL